MQIGSPTALADQAVLDTITAAATNHAHGLYVPAGALWGGHDVKKMADRGTLKVASILFLVYYSTILVVLELPLSQGLRVTMKKHPSAFSRVLGSVAERVKQVSDTPVTLFEGMHFSNCMSVFVSRISYRGRGAQQCLISPARIYICIYIYIYIPQKFKNMML